MNVCNFVANEKNNGYYDEKEYIGADGITCVCCRGEGTGK